MGKKNKEDKGKKPIQQKEPQEIHDSEEEAEVHWMEIEGTKTPFVLPPYMPPIKLSAKPIKDPKDAKFGTFTPLLPKEVSFDDEVLGKIPHLKMEDLDFNDQRKYPKFELSRYLQ